MKKIRITGASGYVGTLLKAELIKKGYEVRGISRELLYGPCDVLKNEIAGCDVLINLAGAPILQRWNKKNKSLIYNSRVNTTNNLVDAIALLPTGEQPKKVISSSAIGIYRNGETHDENSRIFSASFLATVVKDWEAPLAKLPSDIQTCIFRIGLVLGPESKIIKGLKLPSKLGLGATIAGGEQAFPYIHEDDLVNAFLYAIANASFSGILNLVAPENISNKTFTKTLGKVLHRPVFLNIPSLVVRFLLGEAATLLLESPVVIPQRLLDLGFDFKYPTIEQVLSNILE